MTLLEITHLVGSKGLLAHDGLRVEVVIEDARTCFGRKDYLITPVAGSLSTWVSADRVTLIGQEKS